MKTALITGVTGQDGHYLSKFLLEKGYRVYGLVRRTSAPPKIPDGVSPLVGDVTDRISLSEAFLSSEPDEVYNLAAQSHVGASFDNPLSTFDINAIGAANVFDVARQYGARVYQAGTSEQFGGGGEPCDETTPFLPRSPYATAKVAAHNLARVNRVAHNQFVSVGILFNHESPIRGENFVTRKVTRAVGRIHAGTQKTLELGNLGAIRDWGFAGDYVEAMWKMLQREKPEDFVIATGESHSVLDFVATAFDCVGLNYENHVRYSKEQLRPYDVHALFANPSKANDVLGWKPKMDFDTLVETMVRSDVDLAKKEAKCASI